MKVKMMLWYNGLTSPRGLWGGVSPHNYCPLPVFKIPALIDGPWSNPPGSHLTSPPQINLSPRLRYYELVDKKPVPCDDVTAAFGCNRIIKQNRFKDCFVSTVFLVIDHSRDGVPVLFETMIFGGPHDLFQRRYTSWDDAMTGHYEAMIMAKGCKDKRRRWRKRRNKWLLRELK